MQTRPCPSCHEIIPSDVDYCPFCGQNTRETPADEYSGEDLERSRLLISGAPSAAAVEERPTTGQLPAEAGETLCMMCHVNPSTMNSDYCDECREKLEMKPEQWDALKRESAERNLKIGLAAAVVIVVLLIVLIAALHHHHAAEAAPSAATSQHAARITLPRPMVVDA